jgi:hypothetical protein
MTTNEHQLMIFMFARLSESIRVIVETLKSREIWTNDDVQAFAHLVHEDDEKMKRLIARVMEEYLQAAAQSGVVTGLET